MKFKCIHTFKKTTQNNFKMNSFKIIFFVSFLLAQICFSAIAQVTIGSGYKPRSGTLLELKQNENLGANSNKGLLLPRVVLSDLTKLYPMLENEDEYNTSSTEQESQNKIHTGLMVFNSNECFNTTSNSQGVYIWSGSKWERVGANPVIKNSSRVLIYKDQESKDFLAAGFGVAGEWMLQNLSVSTYVDGTQLGQPSVGSGNTKRWAYPNQNGKSPTDNASFSVQPNKGYLYNWYAAANANQTAGKDEGQVNGSGSNDMQLVGLNGICPTGWHLPSDVEWNTLEAFIISNPQYFSTLDPNTTVQIDPAFNGDRGTHSKAMRAICLPVEIAKRSDGLGFPISSAGLSVLLTGEISNTQIKGFGEKASFWTASSYNASQAWKREVSLNKDAVGRIPANATDMLSVRCKKTLEFKKCGDPLTDRDGNIYQTASFGDAGCWMTQNLRSTKNQYIQLREGTNPTDQRTELYAKANGNEQNPEYGYLYTWDAAIAGWDNSEEPLMSSSAAQKKSAMQGICPEGWVLPSDLDWNQLEKEISTNPSKYSTTSTDGSWTTASASMINWRPNENSGWGQIFKTTANNGTSVSSKGMEVEMIGALESGQGQQFGNYAYFWTSNDVFTSLAGDPRARYRAFSKTAKGVYRDDASKSSMLSIRCKQYIQ